jgi:hypothetical protein
VGLVPHAIGPATPNWQRHQAIAPIRFRLFPFRSPLLRESHLLSFPQGTEMFQFPRFPLPVLCVQTGVTPHDGCWVSPFGYPRIEAWSAAPRGFSQPPTSFIGFRRQGIHRWLFVAWRIKDARARYEVLKRPIRTAAKNAWFARKGPAVGPEGAGIAFPVRRKNAAHRRERQADVSARAQRAQKTEQRQTVKQTSRPALRAHDLNVPINPRALRPGVIGQ